MWSFSPVSKTIAALFSSTALAQLMALAILPVLARQLGPAEMGYWGSFIAIFSVLAPVAALALPQAMVVAASDTKAKKLARLSLIIAVVLTLFTCSLYGVFIWLAPTVLPVNLTPGLIFCLAGALISTVAVQIVQHWLLRQHQFTRLAKADFYQALVLNTAKLVLVIVWPVASALMLVHAVLPLSQFFQLKGWQLFSVNSRTEATATPSESSEADNTAALTVDKPQTSAWLLLQEFRDFPLYQSPQLVLNASAQALPVFMLASAFGVASAGFYTLAKTVLLAPAAWVNKAIADFLYPAFSKLQREDLALRPLFLRSTLWLAVLGLFTVLALFYLAPWLFSLLFGHEWLAAAEMAQWLCPWLYCFLVNPPAVKMVMVLRLQAAALVLNIITLLGRAAALWYGAIYVQSVELAILAFSLVGVVHNVLFVALAYWGCCRADRLLALPEQPKN